MSIDLSLDRLKRLAQVLPPYTRPTIHIAGTNGKGSVSAYLSYILAASRPPFRVGRYNSPHLLLVHDCITIDNNTIPQDVYLSARSFVEQADREHRTNLTSFELLTLTAFHIFEEQKVDIAVVEVGMGGRLDATNILPSSVILASALTSVDLDHQVFLGSTVADIAREKAAIARPSRPFIVGKQKYSQVDDVVRAVVAEKGAILLPALHVSRREYEPGGKLVFSLNPDMFTQGPLHQVIRFQLPCFNNESRSGLIPLFGEHQLDNLGVALAVISSLFTHAPSPELIPSLEFSSRITLQSIGSGICITRWPGRLSFHTINLGSENSTKAVVLVDGAHNPASSQTLSDYLTYIVSILPRRSTKRLRLTYILALSHSPPKTPTQTLSPLIPFRGPDDIDVVTRFALLRFTPPEGMPWVKSVPPSDLRRVVLALAPGGTETWVADEAETDRQAKVDDLLTAMKWAVDDGSHSDDSLIILAGSLYLVADFYRILAQ